MESAVAAIFSVKMAEMFNFLPEPETFTKAAVLAIATGFLGAAGRYFFEKAKNKVGF